MVIVFLLLLTVGCAHVVEEPEVIILEEVEVHLYDNVLDLQERCIGKYGSEEACLSKLGFYSRKDNTLHCVKWDFETCGHELFHALQRHGIPMLDPNNHEHFDDLLGREEVRVLE